MGSYHTSAIRLIGLLVCMTFLVACITIQRPIVVTPSESGAAVWETVAPEAALDAARDHFCQFDDFDAQFDCNIRQRTGLERFVSSEIAEEHQAACLNSAYLQEFNVFDFSALADCVGSPLSDNPFLDALRDGFRDGFARGISNAIHRVQRRTIQVPDGCVIEIRQLAEHSTLEGAWTTGCRSFRFAGASERWARYYRFTVDQQATLTFDLVASSADAYLALWHGPDFDGSKPPLDTDDDSGDEQDARLQADLSPGTYIVEATTFANVSHNTGFTLTITRE